MEKVLSVGGVVGQELNSLYIGPEFHVKIPVIFSKILETITYYLPQKVASA